MSPKALCVVHVEVSWQLFANISIIQFNLVMFGLDFILYTAYESFENITILSNDQPLDSGPRLFK